MDTVLHRLCQSHCRILKGSDRLIIQLLKALQDDLLRLLRIDGKVVRQCCLNDLNLVYLIGLKINTLMWFIRIAGWFAWKFVVCCGEEFDKHRLLR